MEMQKIMEVTRLGVIMAVKSQCWVESSHV